MFTFSELGYSCCIVAWLNYFVNLYKLDTDNTAIENLQVDLIVERSHIKRQSFDDLVTNVRTAGLMNITMFSLLEALRIGSPTEDINIVSFIEALHENANLKWLLKQVIWGLGNMIDGFIVAVLGEQTTCETSFGVLGQNDNQENHGELIALSSAQPRERKQLLHHYINRARRMFCDTKRLTSVIDAARTKSKQKRYFMAVCDSQNNLAWAPTQAHPLPSTAY